MEIVMTKKELRCLVFVKQPTNQIFDLLSGHCLSKKVDFIFCDPKTATKALERLQNSYWDILILDSTTFFADDFFNNLYSMNLGRTIIFSLTKFQRRDKEIVDYFRIYEINQDPIKALKTWLEQKIK